MTKRNGKPTRPIPELCQDIRELQRQRVLNLKSRIMIQNRLVATVATADGYRAGLDEEDRLKRFAAARKIIEGVNGKGLAESDIPTSCGPLILATLPAIASFDAMVDGYEKEMIKLVKQLPVAEWTAKPQQRGFGLLMLAQIVGECGDLAEYANPGKLWKRMGCAPIEAHGKTLMPSTWRWTTPGLSAEEWEEAGYNPRRRSIAYLIGEGIVKQNGDGPYRRRYDVVKVKAAAEHDDWKPLRCHRHAMLLATKMLLRELWIEWCGESDDYVWQNKAEAKCAFV